MKIAPIADVKTHFSRFVEECQNNPVVVTKNGRPRALLVAISDEDDLESLVLSHSPRFRHLLDAADARALGSEGLGHDAFWRAVERPKPAQRTSTRKRPKRR
jgi:prevent-host-death family protein